MAMNETGTPEWVALRLQRWGSERDSEALGELLKWQRVRAYAMALRILAHQADAEDAVQQAFLKLLSRTHGFEDARAFKAAVCRAVVQCALDLFRSRRSRITRERNMPITPATPVPSPQRMAEEAEALRLVQEELASLGVEERVVITLCCQEGMHLEAAAVVLDEPRETLRDRLARALDALRGRLKKRGLPLSLLLLAGLLHQGQAQATPATLDAALDARLPGGSCAALPAAGAQPFSASSLLAELGRSTGLFTYLPSVAAIGLLALGGVALWRLQAAPAPESKELHPEVETLVSPAPAVSKPSAAAVFPAKKDERRFRATARDSKKDAGDQVPLAVKLAAEEALKGFKIMKVEKEVRNQQVVYDLEGVVGEKRYDLQVSPAGKVLELKEADGEEDEHEHEHERKVPPPAPAPEESF